LLPPGLPLVAPPLCSPLRRGHLFLVGCCVENHALRGRQKPRCIFHSLFLCLPFATPNNSETLPPTFHRGRTPSPISSPQQTPTFGWLLCFPNPNGSQLRPRPRPPHCFLMGCVSAPKTREPTASPPNPKARAFHGSIVSSGAMRAERGDSPAIALTTRDSYLPDVALTARRGFARRCICCGTSNSAKDPGLPLA